MPGGPEERAERSPWAWEPWDGFADISGRHPRSWGGARGGSHGRESAVVRKQSIAETVLEECQDGAVAGAPARPKTHNVCVCLT